MKYKTYTVGQLSKLTGYAKITLRNWSKEGKIPSFRTIGNHIRFTDDVFLYINPKIKINNSRIVIGYCRVSSKKQIDDLNRQIEIVKNYLISKGEQFKIIQDVGSGINYQKQGLKELIILIIQKKVSKIVVLHRDRLLRFGNELLFEFGKLFGTEIEYIDNTEKDEDQELVEDLIQIVTVFSCKLNGRRSHQSKKFIKELKNDKNTKDKDTNN